VFFQFKSSDWASQEDYNPPQYYVEHMPRCQGESDCLTIGYSIIVRQKL
jgi:hypothetical protein